MRTPSTEPRLGRVVTQRTATIAHAILLIALVGIGLALSLPLLSIELERMGASGRGIGLSTAIAGIASLAVSPFVPRLGARLGVARLVALMLALSVGSLLLFPLLQDYWIWLVLRFFLSVGLSTLFVVSEFWITAAAPTDRRGIVMGVYATVLSLGFAIGPAVLALVGTVGWAPYLAGAALFAAAALPLLLGWRTFAPIDRAPGQSIVRYVTAVPLAAAAAFASGSVETGGISLLPLFGIHRGLDAETAALLVSCVALGNVASQIPLGLLSDRMSKAHLLGLLGALGFAASLALPFVREPLLLYALLFVWGGIAGGLYTIGLAHLAQRYTGADLAGGNAAFVALFSAGPLVGPPLIGGLMDLSRDFGLGLGFATFFLGLLVFYWIERWRAVTARPAPRPAAD